MDVTPDEIAVAQQRAGEAQRLAADALTKLAESQTSTGEAPTTWRGTFSKYLGKAVLAIAAALGLTGLVTVLGAGILYVQYHFAQLPAWQALAVMDDAELVVFGAAALVLFVILGALAVVLVFLIDGHGRATPPMLFGLVAIVALEMGWAVLATEAFDAGQRNLFLGLLALAWLFGSVLIPLLRPVEKTGEAADKTAADRVKLRYRNRHGGLKALAVLLVIGELVMLVVVFAIDVVLGGQFLLAAVLGVALLTVAWWTGDDFLPYGIAVFASVPIFGAVATTMRVAADPVAQPAAVIRKDDDVGLCGLYVGETDKRIYLARVDVDVEPGEAEQEEGEARVKRTPRRDSGRIFWVARDTATGTSIGDMQDVDEANKVAPRLLSELLADRLAEAPKPPATEEYTTTTVTDRQGNVTRKVEVAKGERRQASATDDAGGAGSGEEQVRPDDAGCTEVDARLPSTSKK